jgi:hypothetical protein
MARSTGNIYQLKITLRDISPPIWRRLQVRSDMRLSRLHEILQLTMGWTDSHLHQFEDDDWIYRLPDLDETGDLGEAEDERRVRLSRVLRYPKDKLFYPYDFGDSWRHDIVLEKVFSPEPDGQYPLCVTGRRACPPEDCGSTWGYAEMLTILAQPTHPEYESMRTRLGGDFNSELFPVGGVNQALSRWW